MQYVTRLLGCLLVLCVFSGTALAAPATLNKIVAVVNGEMITLHDVRMRTANEVARTQPTNPGVNSQDLQKTILDSMINDILLVQEANKLKVTVEDAEVENEIKKIMLSSRMSQQAFEAHLVRQGTNITKMREHVKNNQLRQRLLQMMIGRKLIIVEDDIVNYYNKNKAKFQTQKSASFSLIIFPTSVNAQSIYGDIKSGKLSFDDAMKKYTVEGSGRAGGKVTNASWASLPGGMKQLFSQLKPGQMSPLVKSDNSFAVLRLDGIVEGGQTLTLEDARPQVESLVREPLFAEKYKAYVQQLRAKAVIDYRL